MVKLTSSFVGNLVNYYDMFFLNDIEQEINYVKEIININNYSKGGRYLDVGCGTGAFAERLANCFDKVIAVDISSDMIEYAKKFHFADNIHYICNDIRNFTTKRRSNMAVALSHVIGYQLDNNSVEKMLISVNRALEKNGIFLFNFYNEPALFQGELKARYKKVRDGNIEVSRFSNATICAEENVLLLDYYYIIEDEGDVSDCFEIHEKMRYFTVKEMEYYLNKAGFEIMKMYCYGTRNKLLSKDWNAGVVVHKVQEI